MHILKKASMVIIVLVVFGVAGAIMFTFAQNHKPTPPHFVYDSSNIEDWYENQNGNLQALAENLGGEYKGSEPIEKLPVSDMTVHHGKKGAGMTPADNCFVGFSYFNYPLENGLDDAYKQYETGKQERGKLTTIASETKKIKLANEEKEYSLKQYDVSVEGESILSGYEIGFIELASGHIKIEGVCQTAENLALTQPILQAVTFNEQ